MNVEVSGHDDLITATTEETDFIIAVETELNGVFISNDDLPEVQEGDYPGELAILDNNGEKASMAVKSDTPEELRSIALGFLALAEYREKNPVIEVDQKRVKALAYLLDNAIAGIGLNDEAARRLLATGKVTVRTE